MAGQINISGSNEAVQLHGNDDYTVARDFTFPDESGELLIKDANDNVPGVGAINGGPLAGFRNQIINGQFSFWQRNAPVTLAGNGYGPDRWAKVGGSSVTFTRRPLSFGQLGGCEVSGAAIQNSKILQPIEIGWGGATGPFTGQWTLSWYSDAQPTSAFVEFALDSGSTNSVAWTANPAGIQSLGSDRYSLTFTASAPAGNSEVVNVIFVPPTAATWTFSGVQFEPGSVATPFEHRPVGTELALCQRYYQTSGTSNIVLPIGSATDNWRYYRVPRTVTMRATPVEGGTVTVGTLTKDGNAEMIRLASNVGNTTGVAIVNNYTADAEL